MPSSRFQANRHTRKPPPTCKTSWREARIAQTSHQPAVLTGWAGWLDLTVSPQVNVRTLMDVYATAGPTEWLGSVTLPGVVLTLSIVAAVDPLRYDVVLAIKTPTWDDDDSWHDLLRVPDPCDWDTGELTHIHTPGIDENFAMLSV